MKTKEEILESKNRCTITEDASDENENYYFKWKDVEDAMGEYLDEYKKSFILPTDEEIQDHFPEFGCRGSINYDCYTKRNGAKHIRNYIRDKNIL